MDHTGTDAEETIAKIAKTQATLSTMYEELASIDVGLMSDGMWLGWYDLADRREDVQRKIDSLEERLDKLARERDRQTRAKVRPADARDAIPAGTMGNGKHDGTHDVMGTVRRIARSLEHDDSVTVRTRDGRTMEVTAILYDGSGWYATFGTGTYDRHGLRQYGTGDVVRMDDII